MGTVNWITGPSRFKKLTRNGAGYRPAGFDREPVTVEGDPIRKRLVRFDSLGWGEQARRLEEIQKGLARAAIPVLKFIDQFGGKVSSASLIHDAMAMMEGILSKNGVRPTEAFAAAAALIEIYRPEAWEEFLTDRARSHGIDASTSHESEGAKAATFARLLVIAWELEISGEDAPHVVDQVLRANPGLLDKVVYLIGHLSWEGWDFGQDATTDYIVRESGYVSSRRATGFPDRKAT